MKKAHGHVAMTVDVPKEMKEEINELAKKSEVPITRIVRRALNNYLATCKANEAAQQIQKAA